MYVFLTLEGMWKFSKSVIQFDEEDSLVNLRSLGYKANSAAPPYVPPETSNKEEEKSEGKEVENPQKKMKKDN